jgi:hypothetical protein
MWTLLAQELSVATVLPFYRPSRLDDAALRVIAFLGRRMLREPAQTRLVGIGISADHQGPPALGLP